MADFLHHAFSIETTDGFPFEDWPAVWNVDIEDVAAEPYSWGGSRGMDFRLTCEFYQSNIGGQVVDRDMLLRMCGSAAVFRAEEDAQARFAERYQAGELLEAAE